MNSKSTVQQAESNNDFTVIDTLQENELDIKNLPEITLSLEKKLSNVDDLSTSLSTAVSQSIHTVVENTMKTLGVNEKVSYSVDDLAEKIQKFVDSQNVGTFEFYNRAGKNIFKCEHYLGSIGSQYFKDLISSILKVNFSGITYHSSDTTRSVSVVFRQI